MIDNIEQVSILIIGVYYGKFPDWFPYWLRSCMDNPTIDFLLVTDIDMLKTPIPSNVRILTLHLSDIKKLAEEALGFSVSLEVAYKLCDFRPIYGIIFHKWACEYDYWGHCDFDLIFGDIREFTKKYEFWKYDKFLAYGHLALYRNTTEVNNYYEMPGSLCGDYKTVYTTSRGFAFDETDGIYQIYKYNNLSMFDKTIFANIKTYHKRFRLRKEMKNYRRQIFYYEKGKVYRAYQVKEGDEVQLEEFIYVHFRRKLPSNPELKFKNLDAFYICDTGFIPKDYGIPSISDIDNYSTNPGVIAERIETLRFIAKNWRKMPEKVFYLISEKVTGRKV